MTPFWLYSPLIALIFLFFSFHEWDPTFHSQRILPHKELKGGKGNEKVKPEPCESLIQLPLNCSFFLSIEKREEKRKPSIQRAQHNNLWLCLFLCVWEEGWWREEWKEKWNKRYPTKLMRKEGDGRGQSKWKGISIENVWKERRMIRIVITLNQITFLQMFPSFQIVGHTFSIEPFPLHH